MDLMSLTHIGEISVEIRDIFQKEIPVGEVSWFRKLSVFAAC